MISSSNGTSNSLNSPSLNSPFKRRRVFVSSVVSSRYPNNRRPASWDSRHAGEDIITTREGETLRLSSDGQQSPAQPGWQILLTSVTEQGSYTWTLFGIPKGA